MEKPVQCHCLTFGCCGQNFSKEYVDNGSGKDVTYGISMFEEEDDAAFHTLVKQMLADAFDRMQMWRMKLRHWSSRTRFLLITTAATNYLPKMFGKHLVPC
jgi:hypothetical protein